MLSMTGFARKSDLDHSGSYTWELRSVNHRYLEISIRLPDMFRDQEMAIRELIKKKIKRGKIEATLQYQVGEELPYDFNLNVPVMEKLSNLHHAMKAFFPDLKVNFMKLLEWKGVLIVKEKEIETISKIILKNFETALNDLIEMRKREGENLKLFLEKRITDLENQVAIVKKQLPEILIKERKRLLEKFSELQITADPDRLEQELLWLIQKSDIAEEITRTEAHIKEINRILKKGIAEGRRLDFLMQELNREANTTASKSIDVVVSQAAIEMKVLIEQMREQVQNIE